jgi:hypothetical protein
MSAVIYIYISKRGFLHACRKKNLLRELKKKRNKKMSEIVTLDSIFTDDHAKNVGLGYPGSVMFALSYMFPNLVGVNMMLNVLWTDINRENPPGVRLVKITRNFIIQGKPGLTAPFRPKHKYRTKVRATVKPLEDMGLMVFIKEDNTGVEYAVPPWNDVFQRVRLLNVWHCARVVANDNFIFIETSIPNEVNALIKANGPYKLIIKARDFSPFQDDEWMARIWDTVMRIVAVYPHKPEGYYLPVKVLETEEDVVTLLEMYRKKGPPKKKRAGKIK